ncbi:sensor histidine kinase [Rufibacter hautae]|nr:PAS domain-containing sensor histidine kinase [Rufibacter hautae]
METKNTSPGLYQTLLEQTGQAFFAYEVDKESFVYQSPEFQASFKVPADNTSPQAMLNLVHIEDQQFVQDWFAQLQVQGKSSTIEFRVLFQGEQEQWVCLTASLVEEASGTLLLGHMEDITAARRYNDHLKRYSNKKNSVLNILAHDLAGPLGMIQNLSGLLADQLKTNQDEDTQHMLHLIERISKQGSDMLREFMNQEFLESSHTQVVTRRVNLVEKMREAMIEYEIIGSELLPVTVSFIASADEIFVEIDDLKFMQVITNLISNALKFTPDGGSITVTVDEESEEVLVKVADTGIGIPEKLQDSLFEKFTPARRPGLKGEHSVGLGMSIVKTIVEWHRGVITFESTEGKGTTFYIRLPKKHLGKPTQPRA